MRYPDHGCAQRLVLVHRLGVFMLLDRAALGERLRVEIHDDRDALECISERKRVILAGSRSRRRIFRGSRANLAERQSDHKGKSVAIRVDLGGSQLFKIKKYITNTSYNDY